MFENSINDNPNSNTQESLFCCVLMNAKHYQVFHGKNVELSR